MKKLPLLLVLAATVMLLPGCASAPQFGVPDDKVEVVDTRKMQLIEQEASRSGVLVLWVRKPTKMVAKADVKS